MRVTFALVLAAAAALPAWADGDGDWDAVAGPGIDSPSNTGITAMKQFGTFFYLGTERAAGARIYRTSDGSTFTMVEGGGFGAGHTKITEFEEFGGFLYCGTASPAGGQVFRSSDGVTWLPSSPLAFGDAGNAEVMALENFSGEIWAGTRHTGGTGCQLWRSTDGIVWTSATTTGFGDADNTSLNDLEDNTGETEMYAVLSNSVDGGQLLSISTAGGATNLVDDGFGGANPAFTALEIFQGSLYIGTRNVFDGYEVWSTPNEIDFFRRVSDGGYDDGNVAVTDLENFGNVMYVGAESASEPFIVLRTFNGGGYNDEDEEGFGDPGNFIATDFAAFGGKIYCGTINPSGGGLYRTDIPNDITVEGEFEDDGDDDHSGGRFHCVVATAAYGSPVASRVDQLRALRDSRVEAAARGLEFTSLYRRAAHAGAKALEKSEVLRAFVRRALQN